MVQNFRLKVLFAEREIRRVRWEESLEKCMNWVTDDNEEKQSLMPGK